jgi:hypothetical protein
MFTGHAALIPIPSRQIDSGIDLSAAMTACWDSVMIGRVEHFVDDDPAYLGWAADHPSGYVINTDRNPSAAYLMLHRANCHTVTGVPAKGSTFTCDYSKVCGSREELEAFAVELGGNLKPCGICITQQARPSGQRPRGSRYLPLRDYLAGRRDNEIRMSFAEVEELVGRLPDSARLHRAWWSNSSHVARAWRALPFTSRTFVPACPVSGSALRAGHD